MLGAVHRALHARDRWLLIFDNAEDAQGIGPLLPGGTGHVLITTRRSGFRALGGVLDLDTLDRPDAVALLRRRSPVPTRAQAGQLAARLGDLPLALDQAAAYLDQTGMPPEEYVRLLDTRSADLHSRGHAVGHPGTVATVWSVSLDRLQAAAPAAVQLLELCAWLAPEPIPLDLFTGHCDQLPEPLASAAADPVAFNDAVGALTDYSLARRTGGTLIVHRLIQDVTRHRPAGQPAATTGRVLETVLALLRADLPGEVWATPESWPRWRALLPSVLAAIGYHTGTAEQDTTAWLLTGRASTSEARAGLRRRCRCTSGRCASTRPPWAPTTPTWPSASITWAGRCRIWAGPRRRCRCTSGRCASTRPPSAPTTPTWPSASTTWAGRCRIWAGLRRRCRCTSGRCASTRPPCGPDHPDVAFDLKYVGRALSDLGRAAEALPLHQRALRIDEAALGPDHPDVAFDLNQVGGALSALGRAAEALPLHQRALRIHEAALGPDHPDVAVDLNHVGGALSALGRAAEALPLHQRALRIHKAALGRDHPATRQSRKYVEAQ